MKSKSVDCALLKAQKIQLFRQFISQRKVCIIKNTISCKRAYSQLNQILVQRSRKRKEKVYNHISNVLFLLFHGVQTTNA